MFDLYVVLHYMHNLFCFLFYLSVCEVSNSFTLVTKGASSLKQLDSEWFVCNHAQIPHVQPHTSASSSSWTPSAWSSCCSWTSCSRSSTRSVQTWSLPRPPQRRTTPSALTPQPRSSRSSQVSPRGNFTIEVSSTHLSSI